MGENKGIMVSFWIDEEKLKRFEEVMKSDGYDNRSEYIRDIINKVIE